MVEQGTHNPLVLGSSPGGPTIKRTNPRSVSSHASGGFFFFNDKPVPRQSESQDPRKPDYPSDIVLTRDIRIKKEEPPP